MILIASARPKWGREPHAASQPETKTLAPSVYAKRFPPPGTLASRRPAQLGAQGQEPTAAWCTSRALACPPPPVPQHPEGPQGERNEEGAGVDVIGADAAVSSIMDGDDADGGAEPAGERREE